MNNRKSSENVIERRKSQYYICKHCSEPIYAIMNLSRHESICEILGKYRKGEKCFICQESFGKLVTKHFLRNHCELLNAEEIRKLEQMQGGKCKFCKLTFFSSLAIHENECEEMCRYLIGATCKICPKTFRRRNLARDHFKKVHLNHSQKDRKQNKTKNTRGNLEKESNDHMEIKKEISQNERIFDITENTKTNPMILVDEIEPEAKNNIDDSALSSTSNQFDGSRIVTKLQKCPICFAIFAFEEDIRSHLEIYHKMPMDQFVNLGLKIEERPVSEFANLWDK